MKKKLIISLFALFAFLTAKAQLSPLHVENQYFKNQNGEIVILHGFAQTFSPWFNEKGTKWTNYDVDGCLRYNKGIIDGILNAGWKMTFVRQHMDPYWSNTPGVQTTGESDIHAFDFERFKKYLDEVFVPMAEYAIGHGLYVVMRPPGVCPETIVIGDAYQDYLIKVWEHVAQHPKLKNNGAVLFELANEPVKINAGSLSNEEAISKYFQAIVDVMRQHCNNILLVPGLGWQSQYAGFAKYPVKGDNIGYAVHCYPGWYNSGHEGEVTTTYFDFKRGWDAQIGPIAEKAPIVVTEMDWAPQKYSPKHTDGQGNVYYDPRCSFAFAYTGKAGETGFGANFMRICDETCNVSWLLFTGGELLAKYDDTVPDGETFLTDPEACPRPVFRKYQYYATDEYKTLINSDEYGYTRPTQPLFSLEAQWFNPSIWEKGTYDETTGALTTGQYGFGGWEYGDGVDLSQHRYLIVELSQPQDVGASFRLFDTNDYWSKPSRTDFGSNTKIVIDLQNLKAYKDDQCTQFDHNIDPSHIYIAGFWTRGGKPIYIKAIYQSDDGKTPTGISLPTSSYSSNTVYTLQGVRVGTSDRMSQLPHGIYIVGGKKIVK